ncbi:glucan exo-1,3-beta-glucosidase [Coemansia erecta]|nr:glucan exo-1,3-beta-glucosidase [Coemansia erecta]
MPPNLSDSLLDTHIYHVFVEDQLRLSPNGHIEKVCNDGRNIGSFNTRTRTICGEFSLATTDCARWLNGFQTGSRWDGTHLTNAPIAEGATCSGKEDLESWSEKERQFMQKFAMAQFQAYEMGSGWVFWNFKTESADAWNYMKLFDAGIIPNPPVGTTFSVCPK